MFDKLKGGGGGGGSSGGSSGGGGGKAGGSEDAARKALQDTFSNQKKYQNFFGQQSGAQAGGGGGAGDGKGNFGSFGSGGSGGSGPNTFVGLSGEGGAGGGGPERTIFAEILEAFKYAWAVFWNTVLFLLFADMLHRSLDWCCSVELLFLVGAPQQAFERLAGRLFAVIEWFEKNCLGWDIPGDEDMIHQYENIRLFYPRAHAYTFDQYRYKLSDKEKNTMINAYALRHYEREGGHPGDVDPADLAAITARHDPLEFDRQAYARAKASNTLEDYWADPLRQQLYSRITHQPYVRPPGTQAPA